MKTKILHNNGLIKRIRYTFSQSCAFISLDFLSTEPLYPYEGPIKLVPIQPDLEKRAADIRPLAIQRGNDFVIILALKEQQNILDQYYKTQLVDKDRHEVLRQEHLLTEVIFTPETQEEAKILSDPGIFTTFDPGVCSINCYLLCIDVDNIKTAWKESNKEVIWKELASGPDPEELQNWYSQ